MVLHNNKWKNKASKKYYEKHNLSLNTNSQQIPVTKETAASSEVEDDNFDELPSNTWRYEEG